MRFQSSAAALAIAAVLALASLIAVPQSAYAVVNLGTVGVAVPSSVTIESGQSGQVSAACDPGYSDQYPNCLNDYCPSGCDFGKTGEGVACEDKTGQCTCYGYKSARYYPSCTVSSSNPSVVRASWSDGALNITGYKAGSATLTVVPSLRLFSSASATIQVNVIEPAQTTSTPGEAPKAAEGAQATGGQESAAHAPQGGSGGSAQNAAAQSAGSSTGKADASGGRAEASSAGTGGATAVSVAARSRQDSTEGSAVTAQSGQSGSTSSKSGAGSVVRIIEQADAGSSGQTATGDSASTDEGAVTSADVHRLDDGQTVVGSVLAEVAGTARVVTFWGGKSADSPDYMLIVAGANVPGDVDPKMQLSIAAEKGGQLEEQLAGIDYSAFTIDGAAKLPCTAQIFWRTTGSFKNGEVVNVYQYDRQSGSFKKIHSNLTLGEGYACFNLIDGGTYVVAKKDDLDAGASAPADTGETTSEGNSAAAADADSGQDDAGEPQGKEENASEQKQASAPWAIPAGIAAIAVAAGVAVFASKRKGASVAAQGSQGGSSDE